MPRTNSLELRLQSIFRYMPPIWKILFFCLLCLGLAPIRAEESDELSDNSADISIVESEIFNTPTEEGGGVQSEVVSEHELEPIRAIPSVESNAPEQISKNNLEKTVSLVGFSREEESGLEKLGIRKLPQGISIFRYNRQQIKKQISLLKSRTPLDKSIQ